MSVSYPVEEAMPATAAAVRDGGRKKSTVAPARSIKFGSHGFA
jgi:hypothetical protein